MPYVGPVESDRTKPLPFAVLLPAIRGRVLPGYVRMYISISRSSELPRHNALGTKVLTTAVKIGFKERVKKREIERETKREREEEREREKERERERERERV